ncbi:MAG: EpsI family protein [Gammaproteobacteria bacterium]|nr:EpsI family protein [Gammaproteobacteria bacterium]
MRSIPANIFTSLLLLFIVVLAFYPTIFSLGQRWLAFSEAYGHGTLIIGISIYLLYNKRSNLSSYAIQPQPLAALPLCAVSLLWLAAFSGDINILQQVLIPVILLLLTLTLTGTRITRAVFFPILFLYFAIPIWDYLNDNLLLLTITVTDKLLELSNIPALIKGNTIFIPSGIIRVADSCSGLRYLIVGLALSALTAHLRHPMLNIRLAIILTGLVLSLLGNWLRVYSLAMIGYYTEMQSSLMKEHDYYGWLVFFIVFSPILLIGRHPTTTPLPVEPSNTQALQSIPLKIVLFAMTSLLLGPGLALYLESNQEQDFSLIAPTTGIWHSEDLQNKPWQPTVPKAYQTLTGSLRASDLEARVYIYAYRKDLSNSKLLPYFRHVYNNKYWFATSQQILQVKSAKQPLNITQLTLKNIHSTQNSLVWYWFDIGGQQVASYQAAKLSQILANLQGHNFALFYAIELPCRDQHCKQEISELSELLPSIDFRPESIIIKSP